MASIKDCALSLLAAHDLRRGNLTSDDDHDRIVGRVRRDIIKNNGVAGLIAEGQHKRMANGNAPNLYPAGHGGGEYVNTQPADNNPYGIDDESNLNWHGLAGFEKMHPMGAYTAASPDGYAGAAANPMGPMRERFSDLRGIHSQTHGGYASDEGRRPVMVRETHRVYTTDAPLGGCLRMRRVFLTRRFNACGMH